MLGPLANRHWFAIKLAPALPSWLVADLLLIQRFENVSLIVSDLKSPQKLFVFFSKRSDPVVPFLVSDVIDHGRQL